MRYSYECHFCEAKIEDRPFEYLPFNVLPKPCLPEGWTWYGAQRVVCPRHTVVVLAPGVSPEQALRGGVA